MKADSRRQVLLVGGEESELTGRKLHLEVNGIGNVMTLSDSALLLPTLASERVAVAVLDIANPEPGLELLSRLVRQTEVPIIVTARDGIETAVQCIKLGAFDYVVKPAADESLVRSVKRALVAGRRRKAPLTLKPHPATDDHDHLTDFAALVTRNDRMRELFRYATLVAGSGQPILITGETGVGKELMARAIHKLSGCTGEFVALNAAGLDDMMFSDALFGHQKGAYTGADQAREGLIVRAAGGTLFLDEIGDLSESSQLKLLRLLQENEYYPAGSDLVKRSEAHLLLATNRELQQRMAEGRFRQDLYYRLCSHQVRIPPLRERRDDLPLLVEHFIEAMSQRLAVEPPRFSERLLDLLQGYPFPGNVRELQGMVDDAVLCRRGGMISEEPFLRAVVGTPAEPAASAAIGEASRPQKLEQVWGHFPTLREAENLLIETALELSHGNQRVAADMLGLNRQTLNMRLKARRR